LNERRTACVYRLSSRRGGSPRFAGALGLPFAQMGVFLAFAILASISGDCTVVLNEIMYNPPTGNEDEEYVELYNDSSETVEMGGWSIRGGIDYTFPSGATLNPAGYLVLAKSPEAFRRRYRSIVAPVLGGYDRRLGNEGEIVELLDSESRVVDRVAYMDGPPWPEEADGEGSSLELRHPRLDNEFAASWAPSRQRETPGARNSVFETNPTPILMPLDHFPAVPRSSDSIDIRFRAFDESAAPVVTLFVRKAVPPDEGPQEAFAQRLMADDGMHGDDGAGNGVFGVQVAPRAQDTILEFYAVARDSAGQKATAPVSAPQQNCLLQVDDTQYADEIPFYRVVMTPRDLFDLETRGNHVNNPLNCTFVEGDSVFYRCGIRYRGSTSRDVVPKSYRIEFPRDRLFNGFSEVNLNGYQVSSQAVGWDLFEAYGLPSPRRRLVSLLLNNGWPFLYLDIESIEKPFLDWGFHEDRGGNLYRGETSATLDYLGPNPGPYRPFYLKKTNIEEDDYSDIIDLCNLFSNAPDEEFVSGVLQRIDLRQWMRFFAIHNIANNHEGGIYLVTGDDYSLYRRPSDNRFAILAWDLDSLFPDYRMPVFSQGLPAIKRLIRHPQFVRLYYEAIEDALEGVFTEEAMGEIFARYRGILSNLDLLHFENIVKARREFLLERIPQDLTYQIVSGVVYEIPECGFHVVDDSAALLRGEANAAHTVAVRVNGDEAYWDPVGAEWEIPLPLSPGPNRISIQTVDENSRIAEEKIVTIVRGGLPIEVGGTLQANEVWSPSSGTYLVSEDLIVPSSLVLTIKPGTTLLLRKGKGVFVEGGLVAVGTPSSPVSFLPRECLSWGAIGVRSNASPVRFEDCEFVGSSTATILDCHLPATVSLWAATAEFDGCVFRNGGHAIEAASGSSLLYRNGLMAFTTEGIHAENSHATILDSTFTGTTGGDAVVFGRDASRPSAVRGCRFTGGVGSGIVARESSPSIERNRISGYGNEKGVSLEGVGRPILRGNVITDCGTGIAVSDGCNPAIDHNTLVGHRIGIHSYEKNPGKGGGAGSMTSTILWGNGETARFENDSTLEAVYSNFMTDPLPGVGNISLNPRFVDPTGGDYRLDKESPCLGAGQNGTDMGAIQTRAAERSLWRLR